MDTPEITSASASEWRHVSSATPSHNLKSTAWLRKLTAQFARYTLVGGMAFIVDFALLTGALSLGTHYLLATLLGFLGGLIANYLLCILWVWRGTQARSSRDLVVFSLIGVGGLLLTALLMWVSVDLLDQRPQMAKIFIAALVLVWNFGLRRTLVFFR